MQLQFDTEKVYAIALEGGGARGAWQVGAWRALEEAGVRYRAVSGTSVGALNGALMAMRDLPRAEALWRDIRYSTVMDVNDEDMRRLLSGDLFGMDLPRVTQSASAVLRGRGFDVAPLRTLLRVTVDEEKIRQSDVRLFFTTYCVTDKQALELEAALLPPGKLSDMLLASAYFPAFRHEPIDGKLYTDGGVRDVLPLHVLFRHGYRDIIALRIHGFGVERPGKPPRDANVTVMEPRADLGSVLEFDARRARRNLRLGYLDAQRLLYGLVGQRYYIDRTMSERDAYDRLTALVLRAAEADGKDVSLRALHESHLPRLARAAGGTGDYYAVLLALLEKAAQRAKLDELEPGVLTDTELYDRVAAAAAASPARPGLLRWFPEG